MPRRPKQSVTFTEFVGEVRAGKISRVTIVNRMEVTGAYKDNSPDLHTLIPANYVEIYKILQDHDVNVEIKETSGAGWISVLINASPFLLLLAFWVFMMRQMRNKGRPSGTND